MNHLCLGTSDDLSGAIFSYNTVRVAENDLRYYLIKQNRCSLSKIQVICLSDLPARPKCWYNSKSYCN
jgi:hypothetical protein